MIKGSKEHIRSVHLQTCITVTLAVIPKGLVRGKGKRTSWYFSRLIIPLFQLGKDTNPSDDVLKEDTNPSADALKEDNNPSAGVLKEGTNPPANVHKDTNPSAGVHKQYTNPSADVHEDTNPSADVHKEDTNPAADVLKEDTNPQVDVQEDTNPSADVLKEDTNQSAGVLKEDTNPSADAHKEDTNPPAEELKEDTNPPVDVLKEDSYPSADVHKGGGSFLCQLMSTKNMPIPTPCVLRWAKFKTLPPKLEIDQVPPTAGAWHQHIFRAHYMSYFRLNTMLWSLRYQTHSCTVGLVKQMTHLIQYYQLFSLNFKL